MVKFPVVSLVKKRKFFPNPTSLVTLLWRAALQHPYHNFLRVLFNDLLAKLLLLGDEVEVVTEAIYVSLSHL